MRILYLIESAGGGTGRHALDLVEHLASRGHEILLVYSSSRAEPHFLERLSFLVSARRLHAIPLTMARKPCLGDISTYLQLRQLVHREGPFDVLHAHSSKAGALLRMLPRKYGVRIYTPHAMRIMDPYIGKLERFFFTAIESYLGRCRSDMLIAVSPAEAVYLSRIGIPRSRIATIVNGVAPTRPEAGLRVNDLKLPDGAFVFGFVGRLSWQKAPERLVRAFAMAAHSNPRSVVVIIGEGEEREKVTRLAGDLGVSERVFFLGATPAEPYFSLFHVLVLSSRYEAMPYVLLEAAEHALPIVSTDVGGAEVVVQNGVNGLIVSNDDSPEELSRALLAAQDSANYDRLRVNAHRVRSRFSIANMVTATEAVYSRVVSEL